MPIYKINGRRENGKQGYHVRVNYTDSAGKHRSLTRIAFGDKEAKLLEQHLVSSLGSVNKVLTLDEVFALYLESIKNDVREATIQKKKRIYNLWVRDPLGKVKTDAITRQVMQSWKNQVNDSELALRSKQNVYSDLRALLNFAVKIELLPENPLVRVGNFRDTEFKAKTEKFQYYTKEEFQKFMAAIDRQADFKYFVFFALAYFTGMRKGEINALRWSDIEGDVIHVRRSVCQKTKGGYTETPPKNRSSVRDVQMPAELLLILAEQREAQKKESEFCEEYHVCGGYGFLADTSIQNRNKKYSQLAGLKQIRIHDFRHSHASLLANHGINIQEIARRLGHSDIKMTLNTYSHLYPKENERALEILNQIHI